jgi:hypothetical protein
MTTLISEHSPSARGRILAALYLVVIAGGIVAQAIISDGLVVNTDATQTAANIVANKSLYRLGFSIFMVEMVAQIAVSALFYDLLKPVNRSVARISAIIGITGAGIKTLARLFYYTPLLLLGGATYLAPIEPAQLAVFSLLFIKINAIATNIALVFFGFETLLRGWLLFNADFLPRFLGVMSMIGGLGWLTFLWPPFGSQVFMPLALFAIAGVLATTGWLFIRGVDDTKWKAQAALAEHSIWR